MYLGKTLQVSLKFGLQNFAWRAINHRPLEMLNKLIKVQIEPALSAEKVAFQQPGQCRATFFGGIQFPLAGLA